MSTLNTILSMAVSSAKASRVAGRVVVAGTKVLAVSSAKASVVVGRAAVAGTKVLAVAVKDTAGEMAQEYKESMALRAEKCAAVDTSRVATIPELQELLASGRELAAGMHVDLKLSQLQLEEMSKVSGCLDLAEIHIKMGDRVEASDALSNAMARVKAILLIGNPAV